MVNIPYFFHDLYIQEETYIQKILVTIIFKIPFSRPL